MRILTVVGTRPDAIKLLPVHSAAKAIGIDSVLCATAQHIGMLDQVLDIFKIKPDINLQVMAPNQDLFHVTNSILTKMKEVLIQVQPDLVLVQGDTTTSFATALAAFYLKIPIGHVEAGLRTGSMYAPFPEEMNRRFIGMTATYHFAATSLNVANLLAEGVAREAIVLTGNTIVDALHMIMKHIDSGAVTISNQVKTLIESLKYENKTVVLLTAHRRESFDGGLANIFKAVQEIALAYPEIAFIYPHHPNPRVLEALATAQWATCTNIHLLPPLNYSDLVYCLRESSWVATDSGGIQEEAISLGKQVVILRELTERIEGVWANMAYLAGTKIANIIKYMHLVHTQQKQFSASNIYGDGQSSKKIASFIGAICPKQQQVIDTAKIAVQQQTPYGNTNP